MLFAAAPFGAWGSLHSKSHGFRHGLNATAPFGAKVGAIKMATFNTACQTRLALNWHLRN